MLTFGWVGTEYHIACGEWGISQRFIIRVALAKHNWNEMKHLTRRCEELVSLAWLSTFILLVFAFLSVDVIRSR